MVVARLHGPPEHALELEPLSYQFGSSPQATSEFDHDANWVFVRFRVQDGYRRWSCVDPASLTVALRELVLWHRAIADDEPVQPTFTPMEPLLSFESQHANDGVRLQANFALELEPPHGDPWLDFHVQRAQLASARGRASLLSAGPAQPILLSVERCTFAVFGKVARERTGQCEVRFRSEVGRATCSIHLGERHASASVSSKSSGSAGSGPKNLADNPGFSSPAPLNRE